LRTGPVVPVFLFDSLHSYAQLWETAKESLTIARFLGPKQYEFLGYDADLTLWRVGWKSPAFSLFQRIANIGRRSRLDVPVAWTKVGTYSIVELRNNFLKAVAHDDDVLTQFVEPEELNQRLGECETFSQFVEVWQWLSHDS
jgi:hypothetical protein